jgi:hypothetical protein
MSQLMNPLKSLGAFLTSISIESRIKIELLTALAGIAAIVVGVLALMQADRHLKESINYQEKSFAREAYRDFLKLAIEEPNFANGVIKCSKPCPNPEQRYQLFASLFLHTAHQVRTAYKASDLGWNNTLKEQLCLHKSYINRPDVKNNYDIDFQDYINIEVNENDICKTSVVKN